MYLFFLAEEGGAKAPSFSKRLPTIRKPLGEGAAVMSERHDPASS